ncbi:hypothetical protein [Streptomyces fuscichromogenes]|uniref:Isochorismatase n=1 Tax=Streptomyces fuscichromogenes TaxID=1324013 RepID=A0A917XHC2_9ACTN|nr:hypothetical protein [Streptomyces fuscichromogenes]GGN22170.1 hypothetical protein GCM10011578_053790 [Streptomyces fuscichromogenes]
MINIYAPEDAERVVPVPVDLIGRAGTLLRLLDVGTVVLTGQVTEQCVRWT